MDKYDKILENENPIVNKVLSNKKRKVKIEKNNDVEVKEKIILINEKINPFRKIEENIFKKDIKSYLTKENILYFDSKIIKTVNQFYLIQKSLLFLYPNINNEKIQFKPLPEQTKYYLMNDRIKYKTIKNLLIIFETDSGEIICIFLNNIKMANNFCLFMNKNEVYYQIKEADMKEKNYIKKVSLVKDKKFWDEKSNIKSNLISVFFEGNLDLFDYNSEVFLEFYQIIFN